MACIEHHIKKIKCETRNIVQNLKVLALNASDSDLILGISYSHLNTKPAVATENHDSPPKANKKVNRPN